MNIRDCLRRHFFRGIAFLCGVFLACSSIFAVLAEDGVPSPPALLEPVGVKIDTATAYIGEISEIKVYDASIVPYVEEIYFPIAGTVEEVHVIIGQYVKAGDPLITLNHESQTKRLETLEKELSVLEKNNAYADALAIIDLDILQLELEKSLHQHTADSQSIALKQLDIEEKKLAINFEKSLRDRQLIQLRDEISKLKEETAQAVLLAPFDGQIMFGVNLKKGSYINAFQPLIYLADHSILTIEAKYISPTTLKSAEQIFALVGPNRYSLDAIPVDTSDYLSRLLAGETVYSQFSVKAPDEYIVSGSYAALCLESDIISDALLIPSNALYSDSTGGYYVYLIEENERLHRSVKTGRRTDWLVQIVEGLEEGDVVYVKE